MSEVSGVSAVSAAGSVSEEFALVVPDEPAPVRLMNTIWADRGGIHDALQTVADLRSWLGAVVAARVEGGEQGDLREVGKSDVARFVALRDALRRLAALITEDSRSAAGSATTAVERAVDDVNDAVAQADPRPKLSVEGGLLRSAPSGAATPVMRSLASLAAESVDLVTGEERVRLRACYAPGCVLYFVKSHPRREWCSTTCANRVRAARHYQRHRSDAE